MGRKHNFNNLTVEEQRDLVRFLSDGMGRSVTQITKGLGISAGRVRILLQPQSSKNECRTGLLTSSTPGPSCQRCGCELLARSGELCAKCRAAWRTEPSNVACTACREPLTNQQVRRGSKTHASCVSYRKVATAANAATPRGLVSPRDRAAQPVEPTQEEIEKATAMIRAGWSELERRRRCMLPPTPVEFRPCTVVIETK